MGGAGNGPGYLINLAFVRGDYEFYRKIENGSAYCKMAI